MVLPIELESMRLAQEEHLDDEVRIERRAQGTYSASTYRHAHSVTVIYAGPGLVGLHQELNNPLVIGEGMRTERVWTVAIPYHVQTILETDVVVVISARDAWVPREMRIVEVEGGNFGSRRRLICKEIV